VGQYGEQAANDCLAAMDRFQEVDRLRQEQNRLGKLLAELENPIDRAEFTARRWLLDSQKDDDQ
jgi:hypothetical protein